VGAIVDDRTETLDDLDRKIVVALQVNVRASWKQIAQAVGCSETTAARRAGRLRELGLLHFLVVQETLSPAVMSMYLEVRCEPGRARSVGEELSAHPSIRFVALTTGEFEILAEHQSDSKESLTRFLTEELTAIPGIREVVTHTGTRIYKKSNEWARDILGPAAEALGDPVAEPRTPLTSLSDVDQRLIDLLKEDPRRSTADLAQSLGVTDSVTRRRLEALRAGKAVSFSTYIKPGLMGFGVESFAWLDVDFPSMLGVADRLMRLPQVRYLATIAGTESLLCELILADLGAFLEFQSTVLAGFEGLRGARFSVELQSLKRSYIRVDRLGAPAS